MSNLWISKGGALSAPDPNISGQFGRSVSLSFDGNILAVGAINDGVNIGGVTVYQYNDDLSYWTNYGVVQPQVPINVGPRFGTSVDLSSGGHFLVVGCPDNDSQTGAVFGYHFENDEWHHLGSGISGSNAAGRFGYSVSASSQRTIAVGEYFEDSAQVWKHDSNSDSWTQLGQTLEGNDGNITYFGKSVDLVQETNTSKRILAVGAPDALFSGSVMGGVYIYELQNDDAPQWNKTQTIVGPNVGADFGEYVSLSSEGNVLAVGAFLNDATNTGSVHVYLRDQNSNLFVPYGNALSGQTAGEQFGASLALNSDGTKLVVGAWQNTGELGSGAVYNYEYNASTNTWDQKGQLLRGDRQNDNNPSFYGTTVAISDDGNTISTGAYGNDSINAGAAYVYSFDAPPPCFTAGAMVQTDQGMVAIENVKSGEHTIRNKEIVNTTASKSQNIDGSDYLVRFDVDSLGKGSPNKETVCSPLHKIYYNGANIAAGKLVGLPGIHKEEYNGEKLYNIQLQKHSHMYVNGMRAETLHPRNTWAKKNISK